MISLVFFLSLFLTSNGQLYDQSKNYEGSSDLVDLQYHLGPVISSPETSLYIIWYGQWNPTHQSTIRDFLYSVSSPTPVRYPSVSGWWKTVRLYRDETGSNITGTLVLSGEFHDSTYSHGSHLTRFSVQSLIRTAVTSKLPLNGLNGLYLVLTSDDVEMEFCRAICGFHYFTFPSIVGATVPFVWVGNSMKQCPEMCAYPFAQPKPFPGSGFVTRRTMKPPNGEVGIDGMISVIAHELAEVSSNPMLNGWYGGEDALAPTEIADLCLGVYGSGGGGGYMGTVYKDRWRNVYNVNGVKGRKYLIQWVWDLTKNRCYGPNAMN